MGRKDAAAAGVVDDRVLNAARAHGVPVSETNPLLTYDAFARFLTDRGRSTKAATLRSFKRNGRLPLPDLQMGGQQVAPGQTLPAYSTVKGVGAQRRPPQPPDPARPWTETERSGGRSYWLESTAQAWDEARPGPGNWRNDREPLDERIIERYKPRGSASAAPDRTGD